VLSAAGAPGVCPAGAAFELPRDARDNLALQAAMRAARPPAPAAWLPLTGALLMLGGPV